MVILKKIYSENGLFNPIEFKQGMNIIRGIYSKKETVKKSKMFDLNGIGKSTLIRLIDYALVSDSGKSFFNTNILPLSNYYNDMCCNPNL